MGNRHSGTSLRSLCSLRLKKRRDCGGCPATGDRPLVDPPHFLPLRAPLQAVAFQSRKKYVSHQRSAQVWGTSLRLPLSKFAPRERREPPLLSAPMQQSGNPDWRSLKTVYQPDLHGFKRGSRDGDARPPGGAIQGIGRGATHRQHAETERQGLFNRRACQADSERVQRPRVILAQGHVLELRRRLREPLCLRAFPGRCRDSLGPRPTTRSERCLNEMPFLAVAHSRHQTHRPQPVAPGPSQAAALRLLSARRSFPQHRPRFPMGRSWTIRAQGHDNF
jgi:hypothetical protein